MKIPAITTSVLLALSGLCTLMSSCSGSDQLPGLWQGTPERLNTIPSAAYATSAMSLDFGPRTDKHSGNVIVSTVIDVTQSVDGLSQTILEPFEATVTATAQISGRYTWKDDDELLLALDGSTMTVSVDPAGVTFSENILTGTERPVLDSLTTATVNRWKAEITGAASEQFARFAAIDDVSIHHGDIMSCEAGHRDYTFRRVVPQ